MKKGWHFTDKPKRYKPCKCAVCRECYFDLKTGKCVYGGPFIGYAMPDGSTEVLSDLAPSNS